MSQREPLLASTVYSEPNAQYRFDLKVYGGLHYIRGNKLPYFAITSESHRHGHPNQVWSGGCQHDLILAHFPKFADLVALHLSDMNGQPGHAEGNGWYWLSGFADFANGERFRPTDSN